MKNNEKISLEEAKKNPYYWTTYLFEGIDPNDLHVTHKFLKSQSEEDKEDFALGLMMQETDYNDVMGTDEFIYQFLN